MAKGKNGGGFKEGRRSRPAKGGEVDPTLEELQRVLTQAPSPSAHTPAEVLPRDDTAASPAAEAATNESVPAAKTAEPKIIPPELQAVIRGEVPPQLLKKYTEITNPIRRKAFIKNVIEAQKKEDEKENERREGSKKTVKRAPRKPKSPVNKSVDDTGEAPQYRGHIIGHGQLGEMEEGQHIGSAPEQDETTYVEPEIVDQKLQEFREDEANTKPTQVSTAPAVVAYSPEVVTNLRHQRQEANLIRAILAFASGKEDIPNLLLNPRFEPVTPEERAKAVDLIRDPKIRETMDENVVGSVGGRESGQYLSEFQLLGEEAKRTAPGEAEPDEDDLSPAVWRYNRDRPKGSQSNVEPPIPVLTDAVEPTTSEKRTRPYDEYGELVSLYPNIEDIPIDVWSAYGAIDHEIKESIAAGDTMRQSAAIAKLEEFMADQRDAAAVTGERVGRLSRVPDGTQDWRNRWKGRMRGLIEGASEKIKWYTSSNEGLIRRNKELDALGEKIGGLDGERLFRRMGEWYNKRGFATKIGVGAALGLGAAVGASASLPLAFACMSGIAVQRLAGFATMYMKFEKNSHNETWGKEKAMLKAGVYTVLMGLTMKEAIEYASDTAPAHWAQAKVEGWLGSVFGHKATPTGLSKPEAPDAAAVPVKPVILPSERGFQAEVRHADINAESQSKTTGFQSEVRHVDMETAQGGRTTGFQAEVRQADIEAAESQPRTTGFQSEVRQADMDIVQEPRPTGFQAEVRHADEVSQAPEAVKVDVSQAHEAAKSVPGAVAAPEAVADMPSVKATGGKGYEYMMKKLWEDPKFKHLDVSKFDPKSDVYKLLHATPENINKIAHDIATDNEYYKENGTNVQINLDTKMSVKADGNIWIGDDVLAPEGAKVTAPYHPEVSPPPEAPPQPPNVSDYTVKDIGEGPPDAAPQSAPVASQNAPASSAEVSGSRGVANPEQNLIDNATIQARNEPPPFNATFLQTKAGEVVLSGDGTPVGVGTPELAPGTNIFGINVSEGIPHIYNGPEGNEAFVYGGPSAGRDEYILKYLQDKGGALIGADHTGKYRVPYYLENGKVVEGPRMHATGVLSFLFPWQKPPEPNDFGKQIK